jgi:hypothetical protein
MMESRLKVSRNCLEIFRLCEAQTGPPARVQPLNLATGANTSTKFDTGGLIDEKQNAEI